MRRHHRRRSSTPSMEFGDVDEDEEEEEEEESPESTRMKCVSCKEEYCSRDAGTCRECYEEASETEEELKREIEDLKAKVNFLRFWALPDPLHLSFPHRPQSSTPCFSDVVLVASNDQSAKNAPHSVPVPAHRAVLASRSPVFRAMLENEMEESLSGTIKISDVSYDALRAFVNYLYTAEACLDENMACDLLVLAEKYQVKHLKTYCEKFLISKLNWENSLVNFAFAHQHNAKNLLDAALALIMDNMDKLSKREEYKELVEKDPRLVVELYEAYLSKQVNTAVRKDPTTKA
ncbi:BTB/POZ domain-containing protein At4g08455 isoform X2 [Ipomoea triloba]|uniref:BTB/POZ domain-containing protein At4g08455 isoform X1 n=1 Tax=Ipomoea triloba TaxID=35885 RepID=UPI00125E7E0B|nr:BTB/POZ domain-containing protein At4g08455 isoform X1 [Ipomoea triloba]XP_031128340.1 BTB/POZ domain-containing protein At4g08455 isoform X2 [Ipomoea triloba]GMD85233.1 BTB/POZ domain-containing protein At4g08455 [Ipomoea batatas]GMD88639.1 BTB/POZ domain-containing protein At4g08455 [Ipomoea batatas]GME09103.1 BTB/POZ domain-containing protein At4g08455 [Ipomoea batatas]GME19707.1 BTB/POZ domain-containing protein At4g08455 [Ipomoea batatas]